MRRPTVFLSAALAVALLLGPAGAGATDAASPQNTTPRFTVSSQVTQVSVRGGGTHFTLMAEPRCASPSYEIAADHPRLDHLTALLLAAVASARSVTVHDAACLGEGGAAVASMSIDR
mgnify:FL=1